MIPRRLAFAWLLLLVGCGATIHPPSQVADPVPVLVKLDVRHSSLVLPRADGGYVEFTYGDWRYFALADTRLSVGLRALLGSPQAAFGKVEYPKHPMIDPSSGVARWIEIDVDRARAEALVIMLDARWGQQSDTYHFTPQYGIEFVRDAERYHLFNNCNHLVARWLTRLGCRVDGPAVTNDFRLTGK